MFREGNGLRYVRLYAHRCDAAIFVDPPYTNEDDAPGQRLYRYCKVDHDEVFRTMSDLNSPVLMTYHSSPGVLVLAKKFGFKVRRIRMRTAHHEARYELLIERS